MKNANKLSTLLKTVILTISLLLATPTVTRADILFQDLIWCPVGAQPGDLRCSSYFDIPQELVADMVLNTSFYEQDGIIYFPLGSTGAIILTDEIDSLGATFETLKQYSLTLQGGWNGGLGNDFRLDGQSDFEANRIQIGQDTGPWVGNLTIKDILSEGTSDTGLIAYTMGNILIDQIDSNHHLGRGALLFNNYASGNVTIQNSSFNENGVGLRVFSNGNIALTNVVAERNNANGSVLTSLGSMLVERSIFNENNSLGLEAGVAGNLTLTNITANSNGEVGVQNCRWNEEAHSCLGSQVVTIQGTANEFNNNGVNGLLLIAQGKIQLSNVAASGNMDIGALLSNCFLDDAGYCTNEAADVIVTNSVFSDTYRFLGLDIRTGGDIYLTDITAENNGGHDRDNPEFAGTGLSVCNWFEPLDYILDHNYCQNTARSVTIDGSINNFNNNSADGFEIYASGKIVISNVNANNNTWSGAYLDSPNGVTVSHSEFSYNTSLDPYSWTRDAGLVVHSSQKQVTLNHVQTTGNDGYGMRLPMDGNATLNQITSTGNSLDGLFVQGINTDWADRLQINGGAFTDNGDYGLEIYACQMGMNGPQTLSGNTAGSILFIQNPACASSD